MLAPGSFCPYVGLQPYTEEDRVYFFGRERDKRIIASNLFATPLTILYGASGVGKSSVLMAGVVPDLREKPRTAVALFREWQRTDFQARLKSVCADAVERAQERSLAIDPGLPLDNWFAEATQAFGGTILILFDQFEEYFLYHPEAEICNAFESEFARAVNQEDIDVGFLLALREDTLARLDRFRPRIPHLLSNTLRLQHLDASAAEEAMRKPLEVYNRESVGAPVAIEDQLIKAVLAQVRIGKVALTKSVGAAQAATGDEKAQIEAPFLQLVMTRVWNEEMKAGSRVLRLGTLQRLGGAEHLVRTHLDKNMSKLRRRERAIAANLFHFLVTPTGTKIAHTAKDLASYSAKPETKIEPVLDRLSSPTVRILRCLAPEPGQAPRYEIFHDVLAAAIVDWHRRYSQRKRLWKRIRKISSWPAIGFGFLIAMSVVLALIMPQEQMHENYQWERHLLAMQREQDRGVPYFEAILRSSINNRIDAAFSPDSRFVVTSGEATSDTIPRRTFFTRVEIWDTNKWERTSVFNGHDAWVTRIAFSPDGKFFATASADKTVQIRETASLKRVTVLMGHEDIVQDVAFSPDGLQIVTASGDKTARIWDAKSGKSVMELRGHADIVHEATFSPDGRWVLTVSKDKTARLWDVQTGHTLSQFHHKDDVLQGSFSPDGTRVLTASADKAARLWDSATGAAIWTLPHSKDPASARFSDDGRYVVTSDGLVARVWESQSGKSIAVLRGHTGVLIDADFSPDGKWIVTASYDNTAQVWDVTTGQSVAELRGHLSDVTRATFSADGKWILTASADSTARVWEVKPAKMLAELRVNELAEASLSPDAQRVVTTSTEKTVGLWDVATGNLLFEFDGHPDSTPLAKFSPDGKRIFTASGPSVWIVDSGTGRSVAELRHADAVTLDIGCDARSVVTTSDNKTIHVWDTSSGAKVAEMPHSDVVTRAEFSPDGKSLVSASGEAARIWEAKTGGLIAELRGHQGQVTMARFSPDGKRIVTAGTDWMVRIWDAGSGQSIAELRDHKNHIFSAEFSPDSTRLVTASKDKTACIWEAASGKSLVKLEGHWDTVGSARFSPDSKLVVTASADGTGRIWDATTGERIAELVGQRGPMLGAEFSADGSRVATWSTATVRVWQVDSK
jgi:WD40 repeat protein